MNRLRVAVLLVLFLLAACARPAAAPGSPNDNGIKPEHGGGDGGGGM
jgi:hypothetical protein